MIIGEATTTVSTSPTDVFDFVLDLERYRQADRKIGRVGVIENEGEHGTVRFSGRIRGLPGPAGTYPFTRTASRLRFGSPIAGPARWFLDFEGTFDCEETPEGTVVTHREPSTSSGPGDGSPNRSSGGGWRATPPRRWCASSGSSRPARTA